ncbi:MAG: hypothetical protein IJC33_08035 [Clostridia bacterium]|nr:hypothetical protein [Clostridia bacterium]
MQNGKFDIDELVNSLIMEREAGRTAHEPEIEEPAQPVTAEPILELLDDAAEPDEVEDADPETELVMPMAEEPEDFDDLLPMPKKKKKKKSPFRLFARREEDREPDVESWADWGLKPIGQYRAEGEIAPPEPQVELLSEPVEESPEPPAPGETALSGGVDEFPAVQAVAETITMPVVLPSGMALPREEAHTRVLSNQQAEQPAEPQPKPEPAPMDDQLPDQLSLEEMVRVEDIVPTEDAEAQEEPHEDPAERLQRAREEKVREFTLSGEEEEVNEPEDEVEEPEEDEPEIEDFVNYEDTKAVELELQYRCRSSLLTLICTGLLELVLLVLTLLTMLVNGESPITSTGYLTVHAFALALMMGLNYAVLARGLSGLFMLRANNDTAPAVASAVALLSVLVHFIHPEAPLPYWAPLAGLLLLLCAAAHYARAACVRRNFAFVSYPGDKYSAALIEEENALREIGRRAVGEGEASVAYFRRTHFLADYLTNAYEEDRGDDWSRWLTPIGIGLSLVLSLVALLGESVTGFWSWLSVFVGMICLSMQASQLAVQLPLNQCCRTMLSRGGFLVGWKAVRQFGSPDALAVDIADLFPDESMLLHGIKTFSGTHIDDAILTAASLVVRSGGPLAMIFRRIIENKENLLHEVDSLVYEQGMGLSGWVDGRRVFVGNRRLLENHGVDVPSSDYEARYAKDGRRLVYLSVAGQLSAMFVVSYLPDPEIQAALQDLCRSHVTLLVRSCDPNITAADLCECFQLDEYYVDVLPAAAGRLYVQLAERESDSTPAVMASNGHILGTAWVLSVCRSLQVKSLMALLVQTVAAALGLMLCLTWALQGTLSVFQPLLLMLISMALTWLLPLFKRV